MTNTRGSFLLYLLRGNRAEKEPAANTAWETCSPKNANNELALQDSFDIGCNAINLHRNLPKAIGVFSSVAGNLLGAFVAFMGYAAVLCPSKGILSPKPCIACIAVLRLWGKHIIPSQMMISSATQSGRDIRV
jgi:hypothetical protein